MPKQFMAFFQFAFFSLLLGGLLHWGRPVSHDLSRQPASPQNGGGCLSLAHDLMQAIHAPSWKQFVEGRSPFSYTLYHAKFTQYKDLLEAKTFDEGMALLSKPQNSEEIVAFMDALNMIHRYGVVLQTENLPLLTRRKLHSLVDKMSSEKRVLWRDMESIVSEIYDMNLGPQVRSQDFFSSDLLKQRVVTRLFQEELAERGLAHVLPKYRIFMDKPHVIKSFLESPQGEIIKTTLFNLPMFFGAPPLYLPKLRNMRLSKELADEILMQGLGPEQMKKVEDALKLGPLNVSAQARYEIIRRYYSIGATVFLTAAVAYEAYETKNVIEEEREILNQLTVEIGSSLEDAQELERRGYQIFEDGEEFRHPSCRSLESCFEKQGLEKPYRDSSQDERYKSCKLMMDRSSQCPDY